MSDQLPTNPDLGPRATKAEAALDIVAVVTSAVPYLGGPVSSVLAGASVGRKFDRVREVLAGVAEDLRGFKSEATERYVQTEDFADLLDKTLRQAGEERTEEKRQLYRSFLVNAITTAG